MEERAVDDSLFLGAAVFQFQTAYSKGGSELNFGLYSLGTRKLVAGVLLEHGAAMVPVEAPAGQTGNSGGGSLGRRCHSRFARLVLMRPPGASTRRVKRSQFSSLRVTAERAVRVLSLAA
eukprot:s4023_g7.t1